MRPAARLRKRKPVSACHSIESACWPIGSGMRSRTGRSNFRRTRQVLRLSASSIVEGWTVNPCRLLTGRWRSTTGPSCVCRMIPTLTRSSGSETIRTAETIWVPIPSPCLRAVAEDRVRDFRCWNGNSRFGPALVIVDIVTDEMVGLVFLSSREREAIELSYGVASRWRGRGVASRAAQVVDEWCFRDSGVERVELRIGVTNVASLGVCPPSRRRCDETMSKVDSSLQPAAARCKPCEDALLIR